MNSEQENSQMRFARAFDSALQMRIAWQAAWQARGCPPEDILLEYSEDPLCALHVRGCSFCREYLEVLSEVEAAPLPPKSAPQLQHLPAPGQLWQVSRKLSGWGPKNRYYNPPLVLILELLERPHRAVRVAQTYHDLQFAGPGDITLPGGLFAESWNTYTLRAKDLGVLIKTFPKEIVRQVFRQSADAIPDIDLQSVLAAFRRLEIEVAAFFAGQVLDHLMIAHESELLGEILDILPDREALAENFERIILPAVDASPLELLALAEHPEAEMAMAAAEEATSFPVRLAVVRKGRLTLKSALAALSVWQAEKSGFLVGGKIHADLSDDAALFCRMMLGNEILQPSETMLDPAGGFFRVFLPGIREKDAERGKLGILVATR